MMMQISEGDIVRHALPEHPATMDHRGLIEWNGGFVTLGGMTGHQSVSDGVRLIRID